MTADLAELVLAVYPNARGFAFVLFEGPGSVVDWGITEATANDRDARCLQRVARLLKKYRPDVLVLRQMWHGRHADLARGLAALAAEAGIPAVVVSRRQIRLAFPTLGRATRPAIVEETIRCVPMLASLAPGRRKIWNSEDRRMGLFDAAALAMTFFFGRS